MQLIYIRGTIVWVIFKTVYCSRVVTITQVRKINLIRRGLIYNYIVKNVNMSLVRQKVIILLGQHEEQYMAEFIFLHIINRCHLQPFFGTILY